MSTVGFDFHDRVVLVTGVGRPGQIGNAVALAFGKAGAKIVACDVNAVGVAERVREFSEQGVEARPCAGDLTQPDIAALAVETAVESFGRLDVVVNVAGGLTTYGSIADVTPAGIQREIAINLTTAVLVSQAAVDALAKTEGCIVNFASVAYFQPMTSMAVYTAAKCAVAGFTRSLAVELAGRKVRVNAIAPATARTSENVAAMGTSGHFVELRHITDGVMFLASSAADMISGHILPVAPVVAGLA